MPRVVDGEFASEMLELSNGSGCDPVLTGLGRSFVSKGPGGADDPYANLPLFRLVEEIAEEKEEPFKDRPTDSDDRMASEQLTDQQLASAAAGAAPAPLLAAAGSYIEADLVHAGVDGVGFFPSVLAKIPEGRESSKEAREASKEAQEPKRAPSRVAAPERGLSKTSPAEKKLSSKDGSQLEPEDPDGDPQRWNSEGEPPRRLSDGSLTPAVSTAPVFSSEGTHSSESDGSPPPPCVDENEETTLKRPSLPTVWEGGSGHGDAPTRSDDQMAVEDLAMHTARIYDAMHEVDVASQVSVSRTSTGPIVPAEHFEPHLWSSESEVPSRVSTGPLPLPVDPPRPSSVPVPRFPRILGRM
jgi:hypothetical protein